MEGIFAEFENENALRSYPFAAGCTAASDPELAVPPGVFVDAVLYPVNSSGVVYLSGISSDGEFMVSDDTGVIMRGRQSGSFVELYDTSPFSRHTGTLVSSSETALEEFAGRGGDRTYSADVAAFASGCVFPVEISGVESVEVGDAGIVTGDVSFANGSDGAIRVSGFSCTDDSSSDESDGMGRLRFDVLPRPGFHDPDSIRRIICVVDGQTPFRIMKLAYNVVMLSLHGIDRDDVCSAAHRGSRFIVSDTCECGKQPPAVADALPETYHLEEVFIPPDPQETNGGLEFGADNAFYIVVNNTLGYVNPLSITLDDGVVVPKTEEIKIEVNGNSAEIAEGELLDSVTGKGVTLQIPGLGGGNA